MPVTPSQPDYSRPEHQAVAAALRAMDHDLLLACNCWFGGGTEIVLDLGEYRLSKDVAFLCADADGYRRLRSLATSGGASALFSSVVQQERAFRTDQYGIRGIISAQGTPLRLEIIREARIELDGGSDQALGVPRLLARDRIAEKLLANADRCQDRSTAYRDAIDLGMLALYCGPFPEAAWLKAEHAYGEDITRKIAWVMRRLAQPDERRQASQSLGMGPILVEAGARALLGEVLTQRPAAGPASFVRPPPYPRQTHMVDACLNGHLIRIRKRPPVGSVQGKLDNPLGPAVLSPHREEYFLDGVGYPGIQEWRDAVSRLAGHLPP